jgi:flavin reductase (DIM6/NTAB) family NADH-FMN oxidoreductase RutF
VTGAPHSSEQPAERPSACPPDLGDKKALRRAFGVFATGVAVVTVGGATPHAMTANSFTSVSLDPPLVLVCIGHEAVMHGCLDTAAHFGVSVLSADQEKVAGHFADRARPLGAAQFETVDWTPGRTTRVPMIDGGLGGFECEMWRRYAGGDHTIYVGRVLSFERAGDDAALLFLGGRFRHLSPAGNGLAV